MPRTPRGKQCAHGKNLILMDDPFVKAQPTLRGKRTPQAQPPNHAAIVSI